jgi:hypothetical protein
MYMCIYNHIYIYIYYTRIYGTPLAKDIPAIFIVHSGYCMYIVIMTVHFFGTNHTFKIIKSAFFWKFAGWIPWKLSFQSRFSRSSTHPVVQSVWSLGASPHDSTPRRFACEALGWSCGWCEGDRMGMRVAEKPKGIASAMWGPPVMLVGLDSPQ